MDVAHHMVKGPVHTEKIIVFIVHSYYFNGMRVYL